MMYNQFEPLEVRRLMAVNIAIDATQRFERMQGFGTSIAAYTPGLYNSAWTDMYFQDLGSSMLRMDLNINALRGADNDIATPVTMIDDINQNIAQFNFHYPSVQPYGDVAMASLSKKIDDFKIIASLWTPPHWMKGPELNATTGQPN